MVWCDVMWCGLVWCGVVWCGVVWCGVVWCGVVWCGVVWCGSQRLLNVSEGEECTDIMIMHLKANDTFCST